MDKNAIKKFAIWARRELLERQGCRPVMGETVSYIGTVVEFMALI